MQVYLEKQKKVRIFTSVNNDNKTKIKNYAKSKNRSKKRS